MLKDLDKTLVSRAQIAARIRELAAQIARDLESCVGSPLEDHEGEIVFVPVLTGSIVFLADLIRELPLKLSLRLVAVSSYPGKSVESKGARLRGELPPDLAGKHVVVVDDILDSGQTLEVLTSLIAEQSPASLRTCVLLRKPGKSVFTADYVGFDIPDEFVVGYGLDYDGFYRNHPEIATLRPEAR